MSPTIIPLNTLNNQEINCCLWAFEGERLRLAWPKGRARIWPQVSRPAEAMLCPPFQAVSSAPPVVTPLSILEFPVDTPLLPRKSVNGPLSPRSCGPLHPTPGYWGLLFKERKEEAGFQRSKSFEMMLDCLFPAHHLHSPSQDSVCKGERGDHIF